MAGVVTVLLLLLALPINPEWDPLLLAMRFGYCVLGGLAVLRPVLGGIALGTLLTLLVFLVRVFDQVAFMGMASLALLIPIIVCSLQRHRIWALIFLVWFLGVSVVLTVETSRSPSDMAAGVNFWVLFLFAPLLLGESIRRLQQRAERQRRAQVVAAERQRRAIARDLHDTLAYATTTMVMRAEEARLRGDHDEHTLRDLDFIAATGRSASADLRTMLAMLRDSESEVHDDPNPLGLLPASRLEEVIDAQAAKLRAFEFDVNLSTNGNPADLSERVATVIARVITEAASNITKHGDRCQEVTVMLDLEGSDIEAVLVNSIRSDEQVTGPSGLGLLGLREIVAAEGGTLSSGPVGGRWITHLTLPTDSRTRGGDHRG